MDTFLLKIFEALDKGAIRYCLLRGYEDLARNQRNREVDLLVDPKQLMLLAETLARDGFASIPSWGYSPHHFFVAYDQETDAWIKFDVVTDLRYGMPIRALHLGSVECCLRHRCRRGPAYVLPRECEFFKLLLHCLLHKGDFAPKHQVRLTELTRQLKKYPRAIERVTMRFERHFAPALTWSILARAIDAQDWRSLTIRRAAVARRLFWRDPIRSISRYLAGRLLLRLRPLLFTARCRGLLIAFLAPDGAGKTTLAQQLAREDFVKARLIYMGSNQDSKTVSLPTTKWLQPRVESFHDGRRSSTQIVLKGLRFGNRLAEQWYRYGLAYYHKLRGRFVVFDRFVYDSWLNSHASTPWKRLRRWLLEAGCPTPDLVVLLDAPGEVLFERKREHTPDWLEQQRRAYLRLRDRLPQMAVVDATLDAGEVRRRVASLIWKHYRTRTGKRERSASSC